MTVNEGLLASYGAIALALPVLTVLFSSDKELLTMSQQPKTNDDHKAEPSDEEIEALAKKHIAPRR